MARTQSLDRPDLGPIRDAATAALGRRVTAVERRERATYVIELGSGETATLKLASDCDDAERLVEPCLLSALGDADLPTPTLLAAVGPDTSPFGMAFCIVSVDRGQRLDDVLDLPERAHERLVREAGDHLAALHTADIDARISEDGGPYGDLRVPNCHPDSPLVVVDATGEEPSPGHERWPARIGELTERTIDALRGGQFEDLGPTIRQGVAGAELPAYPPAVPLHLDYRPENLVFEPGITWPSHARRESSVVRTVCGLGAPATGDGLLDLAVAEDALVGLPLGGTERARELAAALREAYVAQRGVSTPFGDRYAAYLLLARGRLLATTAGHHRLTREHDAYDAAIRCRERVETLARELR